MTKQLSELEDDFWKRFPDINIDDSDFLLYWYDFIYCKTEEEVQEVLKHIEDEKENYKENNKNQKTSFWQKLFGH